MIFATSKNMEDIVAWLKALETKILATGIQDVFLYALADG